MRPTGQAERESDQSGEHEARMGMQFNGGRSITAMSWRFRGGSGSVNNSAIGIFTKPGNASPPSIVWIFVELNDLINRRIDSHRLFLGIDQPDKLDADLEVFNQNARHLGLAIALPQDFDD